MTIVISLLIGIAIGGFVVYYLKDREFRSKLNTKAGDLLDKAGKNMYPDEKKKPARKAIKKTTK